MREKNRVLKIIPASQGVGSRGGTRGGGLAGGSSRRGKCVGGMCWWDKWVGCVGGVCGFDACVGQVAGQGGTSVWGVKES